MATRTGSAAEFVLDLMQRQPDRAWRISELQAASDGKWKADNFTETLKRLLVAGQVKKTIGADRAAWWSAVTAAPVVVPPIAKTASAKAPEQPAPVDVPVQPTGTAAQFILELLARQPDLEWRVAEIVQASGSKWGDTTIYNTLTKLLAQGRVKKTVADRQAWWGIATANLAQAQPAKIATPIEPAPASSTPEKPTGPKPVPQPASAVLKSDKPVITATEFVVHLLANHPAREWRIAEIVQAGGQKWTEPNVYKSLARLFANGQVNKTIKGTAAWWSAAATATATPTKNSTPAKMRVTAAPSLRFVNPAAVEGPATAASAAIPAPVPPPAAGATKPALTCGSAASFMVKLLRQLARKLVTRVTNAKKAASRSGKR